MDLNDDGCLLDIFICGDCKNQFWVESYEVDLALNDPVCCPFCCVMFEALMDGGEL